MKYLTALLISIILCMQPSYAQEQDKEITKEEADGADVSAPSALLMEKTTGQIIFEKDGDTQRPPASVTKIMTLLLIFDALKEGEISLADEVVTSEYAASMGGSQVYLEPGETQTVDTMIKCIAVASANDACVAMAEYICGSEEAFVDEMNKRANELEMKNTNFKNCNGLDTEGHLTTARDIAIMSRELIVNYPEIRDYCMIWQEPITHKTQNGTEEFGLTNTNKLVRHYEYATGLKTGSTSQAKFCISATAEKEGFELIAVIMAAEDSKSRNADAVKLFGYGFSKIRKYEDEVKYIEPVKLDRGEKEHIKVMQEKKFDYVDISGADLTKIERKIKFNKNIKAPVKKGEQVGSVEYYISGKKVGDIPILATESVKEISYNSVMKKIMKDVLL